MLDSRRRRKVVVAVLAVVTVLAGVVAWRVLDGGAGRLELTATSDCTYDEADRTLRQTLVLRGRVQGSVVERLRMVVSYREGVGPERAGTTVVDRAEVQCGYGYA